MVTDLKKWTSWEFDHLSRRWSLSVCPKERKIMCLADDKKVDKAVYKLIFHIHCIWKFHISEIMLALTISDIRGSTVLESLLIRMLYMVWKSIVERVQKSFSDVHRTGAHNQFYMSLMLSAIDTYTQSRVEWALCSPTCYTSIEVVWPALCHWTHWFLVTLQWISTPCILF